ncbi:MAG: RpiB/LacA/LacB family sugar-phosphate isomerase [Oscillospiraceae bacterium]|nr:RpiB/LacA/LacB family sugar-phosphate isomerase [Oscillospiraceae bacterium]
MRIAVIQASSMADRNALLFDAVCRYAKGSEVFNFGCCPGEEDRYSYIEISLLIGLLLSSGAADLAVTGCASGQGMMLACNSMPGVICGYAPTPRDAYLFAQINDGNAVSLPLGEGYTWAGVDNLKETVRALFSEPFGQGWPREDAERKLRDTAMLKEIRRKSQKEMTELLDILDRDLLEKAFRKTDVMDHIMRYGTVPEITERIKRFL